MMRRRWLFAGLLAATLAGCTGTAPSTEPPVGSTAPPSSTTTLTLPDCTRPHAPGHHTESFTFEERERTYQLYVPPIYDGTAHVPLVLNFHGFGSNAGEQMFYGDFAPLADRDNFVVVAPEGQGDPQHFNLTGAGNEQSDLEMTAALLDHLERELCIDPRRIYSTGMSNGGVMSSLLGCALDDRLAAIAPVAAIFSGENCRDKQPMPIVAFMGTGDAVVPFNGGRVNCCGRAPVEAAPKAMAGWAAHNRCEKKPDEQKLPPDVRVQTWQGCADRADTVFYIVEGGGHTWPGGIQVERLGRTTDTINASEVIWEFFRAHARG